MNPNTEQSETFLQYVGRLLKELEDTQSEAIDQAAELIARARQEGKTFYVFGSGHSHILAEEVYARAGGLAFVKAMLPTELMVIDFPTKSTFIERLEGYSAGLAGQYRLEEDDVIVIASNSGRNAVPVEMALEAKKRGCKVIAVTSLSHSKNCSSRHSSGKKLYELADVVIDNLAPAGDAAYPVKGTDICMGPVSDILGCSIMQAMVLKAAEKMAEQGQRVPVFKSSNADGGDDYNAHLFDENYGYKK